MNTGKFIDDIHTIACEEVNVILEKAEKEVSDIIQDAKRKGTVIEEIHRDEAEKIIETQKVTALFNVRSEVKKNIMEKCNMFDSCFETALNQLREIRKQEGYYVIFKKLLREALEELDEPNPIIHIDARDATVCKDVLRELVVQCNIQSDIESIGGLCVSSSDEKITVLNTIESRVERARELLKQEIFGVLYGS